MQRCGRNRILPFCRLLVRHRTTVFLQTKQKRDGMQRTKHGRNLPSRMRITQMQPYTRTPASERTAKNCHMPPCRHPNGSKREIGGSVRPMRVESCQWYSPPRKCKSPTRRGYSAAVEKLRQLSGQTDSSGKIPARLLKHAQNPLHPIKSDKLAKEAPYKCDSKQKQALARRSSSETRCPLQ